MSRHSGQSATPQVLDRLTRYGHGFHPLGAPSAADLAAVAAAMNEAGRSIDELEFIGGTRAVFPDDTSCADLGQAMAAIPEQMAQGFTTFCLKPSQFIDDGAQIGPFCREVIRRAEAMAS